MIISSNKFPVTFSSSGTSRYRFYFFLGFPRRFLHQFQFLKFFFPCCSICIFHHGISGSDSCSYLCSSTVDILYCIFKYSYIFRILMSSCNSHIFLIILFLISIILLNSGSIQIIAVKHFMRHTLQLWIQTSLRDIFALKFMICSSVSLLFISEL